MVNSLFELNEKKRSAWMKQQKNGRGEPKMAGEDNMEEKRLEEKKQREKRKRAGKEISP
jgi:hypothetical protein